MLPCIITFGQGHLPSLAMDDLDPIEKEFLCGHFRRNRDLLKPFKQRDFVKRLFATCWWFGYLQFWAHLCCVIKPWDAWRGFSSAPLNRNTIGCVNGSRDVAKTRRTSNITTTIAPSSPDPKWKEKHRRLWRYSRGHSSCQPTYPDYQVWSRSGY